MTEELKGPSFEEPSSEPSPEKVTPAASSGPGASDSATEAHTPAPLLASAPGKGYGTRFLIIYSALGLVLAGALTGLVVLVIRPGYHHPAPWSTWKPTSGTTAKVASAIADHVASEYKLNAKGTQLVAVVAGSPKVTSGTKDVKISAIAVRKAPQSNAGIQVLASNKTWTDQLCGLGPACSISGEASATRGRLVRREALEVALYTFKFVPSVESVVAFMPPPPGTTTTTLLFLQKANLKDQLSAPLRKTLTLPKPPLPTTDDTTEATTIDRLTLPAVYSYQLTQLQDGSAALILDPVST